MRALITGIAGFAGSHLAEQLLAEGAEVHGIVRARTTSIPEPTREWTRLHEADLLDRPRLVAILEAVRPDRVYHLAGRAAVGASWADPAGVVENNVLGQLNLLEAIVATGSRPRVLVVGSSEEYGVVRPDELPVAETNPLRPDSPYALSKVAQDLMGLQYFLGRHIACVRVRPFNQIGPRQSDAFVVAAFARQVAEAEAGLREPVLAVGNLETARDFTDVRDMARAYALALEQGEPGEVYNVGSGKATPIATILEFLAGQSRLALTVRSDPQRFRPSDCPVKYADCRRFAERTGWRPEIPIERTLTEVLDYWRDVTRRRALTRPST